jgi:predicted RNA-binding protein with PIN domain
LPGRVARAVHLIVDGYNLGRSGALPFSRNDVSEEARAELCALLSAYSRAKGFRLTVVFDGQGTGRRERSRVPFKGGTAVFSSGSETADDVIRALAGQSPPRTVVVTSDRGLAGTLPSRNVAVVSCDEFAARLLAHQLEEIKGSGDDERDRRAGKKGESRKPKKKDRERVKILGKL